MQRRGLPRHGARRRLGVYSLTLIGLGVGAGLASIAAYVPGISLPGRPVVEAGFSSIARVAAGLIAVLGALSALMASRIDRYIGFLAAILYLLVLAGYWWGPLAASLLVLLVVDDRLLVAAASSLLPAVPLALRPLSEELARLGAAALLGGTLTSLALGVAAAVIVLLLGGRDARLPHQLRETGRRAGWALAAVSMALAVLVVLAPHLRYGFDRIVSYDTYYNLRFCGLLENGDYGRAFLRWQRPLYVVAVTAPAALAGCRPWFFDVLVPAAGLVLLVMAVWRLTRRWLGSPLLAGFASLLSLAYWAPFFLYAGFQTNLLALPVALYLLYLALEGGAGGRMLALLSLFLGLWHPWSLAFYTLAMLLSILALGHGGRRVSGRSIAIALLPGWAAYLLVALLGRSFSVAAVAKGGSSKAIPLLWSLKIHLWGVTMRPEILLPVALGSLSLYLSARGAMPRWLLGAVSLGFLAVLVPNAKLLARFMIDAPMPLLLVYLAARSRHPRASLVAATAAAVLMLAYFLESLEPVILFTG